MFDQLTFCESATLAAIIVFLIALSVFLFIVAQALKMTKSDLNHMSQKPLEPERKEIKHE